MGFASGEDMAKKDKDVLSKLPFDKVAQHPRTSGGHSSTEEDVGIASAAAGD